MADSLTAVRTATAAVPGLDGPSVTEARAPVDPFAGLTARPFAIVALLCFAPVVVSFAVAPGAWWTDYPGILFHLAMFMVVAKLPAPGWAKAAGFAWLALDVTTGVMTLNAVPHAIAIYVRYGGHIFGGAWIATASLSGGRAVKIVGLINGLLLFSYTFVSPFVPAKALAATAPLWLVWLAIVAWQYGPRRPHAG